MLEIREESISQEINQLNYKKAINELRKQQEKSANLV